MNTFFKQFSCFLFILFFTCSQVEARDSKFFYKYVHFSNNNNKNYVTVPSSIQSLAPTPAPAPLTSQINNAPAPLGAEIGDVLVPAPAPIESANAYYGLYGKGSSSNQFPFKTTTTTTTEGGDDEFSTEEFRMENFNELNSRESNNYNNNFYPDNYNNNGYTTESYTVRPQGMSDTRSLENGKYYYDIKNDNYNPNSGYEPTRETNNEEGYYNQKSKYEFDSMEEYEKKNNYPDVLHDKYVP
ncbi:protein E6-like [Olea europaea var. sylvestris]|uniref:protein E6-like n=1 Tax=Olea europaea var. sylvestris TaxID=158386 RepID=UPI000C1D742D|nr:protein E6-like [Olea europaea var. sylvestris]